MAVVGVRLERAGRLMYFQTEETLMLDDKVIVPWQQCVQLGYVVQIKPEVDPEELGIEEFIIRKATDEDYEQLKRNEEDAEAAFAITNEKIQKYQLDMKLVHIAYTFDRNKMLFYFTSDNRVDFRQLVKDLASIFRTRIELRQIGVRDEAKRLGGIGPCGRPLCCHTFLGDFVPVSIKMAKVQELSLNPNKISGLCGRLMCCLQYENDVYLELKEQMPDRGAKVLTPKGPGHVIDLNILKQTICVKLDNHVNPVEYMLEELLPYLEGVDENDG